MTMTDSKENKETPTRADAIVAPRAEEISTDTLPKAKPMPEEGIRINVVGDDDNSISKYRGWGGC